MLIKAYAKVNLYLDVLSKREDGYHDLLMYNIKTTLHDDIIIKPNSYLSIKYSIDELNNLEHDLIKTLLEYIYTNYDIKDYYSIYINKRIPVGGGLGGTSSDAAEILKFFDHKYHLTNNIDELAAIGKKFGADIPFLVYGKDALVEGIGEKITPLKFKYHKNFYLINNNINISTAESFKKITNLSPKLSKFVLTSHINNLSIDSFIYNKLEESTFKIEPSLSELKNKLSRIGFTVMSGSGSTFVLFSKKSLVNIKKMFPNCSIFKVKSR